MAMGSFTGRLVLKPYPRNPRGPLKVVAYTFGYIDQHQVGWEVRAGQITDGASIPLIFKPIIGGSFRPEFLPASVIHDHYCTVQVRPWSRTQRVFLEILIDSGVPLAKANAMYYAVLVGSSKWGRVSKGSACRQTSNCTWSQESFGLVTEESRFEDPALAEEVAEVNSVLENKSAEVMPEDIEKMARERHPDDGFLTGDIDFPPTGFPADLPRM
ncbi:MULTISPECIES: DUF1353 domain-containing protein [unclassified Aureimonas]|uniref:DUF1353 domain-containing protein n=1 Tax=unclassified Aureimonas TaxID=2615206 RepID=UPI0009E8F15F|nr:MULTISPECIES: DUF1353 domain-containing protein [unclassified Aureimonas]